MLFIIAHHYVMNSGLIVRNGPIYADPLSWRSVFLLVFGAWGKIGINCFILITGYFMSQSQITAKKFFSLFLQFKFYQLVIALLFWLFGYKEFTLRECLTILLPATIVGTGFTSAFNIFFLTIPFLNILIHNLNERQHIKLLILCGFVYVILGSIPIVSLNINYVSWFIVLFFFASYINLYPKRLFYSTAFWGWSSLLCFLLCASSPILCTWIGIVLNKDLSFSLSYYFIMDSNKLLAFISSLCFFLFFKNLKIRNSKTINRIASSTYGVLLIHANSDTMRQWLWKDTFNKVGWYGSSIMPLHAVISVVIIFSVCIIIDQLRKKFIEIPFFLFWDKRWSVINEKYNMIENKIMKKISEQSIERQF